MPNGREEREGSALPPSYQRLSLKTSGSTTKCIDQYKKHQLKNGGEKIKSLIFTVVFENHRKSLILYKFEWTKIHYIPED